MRGIPTGKTGNLTVGHMMRQFMCEESILSEEVNGDYFLEGIFMQGDVLNNNKRVYPTEMLHKSIKEYDENFIQKNRAFGECGHPDSPKINLDRVCILIQNISRKGNDFYGRAKVVHEDHPMGKIVRGLIKTGAKLGVSSRGLGSANPSKFEEEDCNLVDSFVLRAVDIVSDPSAPNAMVEAIREEKQYILDANSGDVLELNEESYKLFESKLKVLPTKKTPNQEQVFNAVKIFLKNLR